MKVVFQIIFVITMVIIMSSCNNKKSENADKDYNLSSTTEILLTSESGDKIARKENVSFKAGKVEGAVIQIKPDIVKQTIDGIGSSFT